jgi:hypothetical protein
MINSGKNITGRDSVYASTDNYKHVLYGEVIRYWTQNLGRIKVRIKGGTGFGDDGVLDNKLPWCFPLMPKHFSVQPKNNETVLILTFSRDKQHTDRLYIGPIISQSQN